MNVRSCYYLSLSTSGLIYILILAGGLVHSTGSSLACPDWPLCYGQVFPEMKGGVLFEHGHRIIAGTAAILTMITAFFLWKSVAGRLRYLGIIAVLAIVFQSILGGITVIYKLPTLVSTAHLALGTAFISLMIHIACILRPNRQPLNVSGIPRRHILFTTAVVYIQIIIGGFVRHTGSGRVCDGFPGCGLDISYGYISQAGLHMFHRVFAVVVLLAVISLLVRVLPVARTAPSLLFASIRTTVLVIAQVALGIMVVLTNLNSLTIVMAHLGIGVLLLAQLVIMSSSLSKIEVEAA